MPQAIPVAQRQVIVERHQPGASLEQIAGQLGLSPWTVRTLWRRYRDRGPAGLEPDYAACGRAGARCERRVYRAALWLKRAHPGWGGPLIRTLIQQRWPEAQVPVARNLQRWFRAAGINTSPRQRRPREPVQRATAVHETWEMDAKEQVRLADASGVSWLTLSDEKSGAILDSPLFPPVLLDPGHAPGGASRLADGIPALGTARAAAGG